jgi:hypothetical protein
MRSTKARPELDRLIVQLRGWQTAVPDRARRFQAIRGELEREIQGALPFWTLWIGDEVVERYRDRVRRLQAIADPLADLIHESELLEGEVRRLAGVDPPGDAEVASCLRTRCRDWLVLLGRLGANCEREGDLSSDEETCGSTERAVRLHHEAIHQLSEADRVLTTVGSDVRAAALSGLLPQLRRRLCTDGATPEWIDELKGLIQPLRTVAERIQDPPRELSEVGVILAELRGWSALLGRDEDVRRGIERLEERRFKIADWEQDEAHELVAEAQRLREQLLERSDQLRGGKFREAEQGLADLRHACGDQPDLDRWLAELASRQSNRPQLFRDWLAHFEKYRHSFKAVAQSHIGTLETRLEETRERIGRKLEQLEQRPLSDAARRDAVLYGQDLRRFRAAEEVEEILVQLRTANDLERQVDGLERRAAQELEALERQQRELAAKHAALESELGRVKGVELDLSGVIARLAAFSGGLGERSLEDGRRDATALATELETLEAEFVAGCHRKMDEHLRTVQRAGEVLRRAGATPPPAEVPAIRVDATPREAADAVAGARRLHHILLRLARSKREDLENRRARARADVNDIRPDHLGPAERQRAEQLLRELDDHSTSRQTLVALESLAILVEKCDRFFDLLQQEQRSARERLAELHLQFRAFTDEQLSRFCLELSERVAALLYGLPKQPRQWSAVHRQLDRAADLFGRVRLQAQRLAADELDRAVEALRARLRGSGDASFRNEVQKLLAELDACGPEALPPAMLRQRVLNASQRRV